VRPVQRVLVTTLTALGVAASAAPAGAGPESSRHDGADQRQVPVAIRVPDGNKRIAVMAAKGVQTYQCTNAAWVFVQPDAILDNQVLHSKGPVWTSVRDGSSVTAAAVANSPVDGAIPQLLLQANGHRAPGLLGTVTFVQRLTTRGGTAPAGSCTEGVTASVPYTATYTFWVAR
jgi:uncharacterized protein DUF3455